MAGSLVKVKIKVDPGRKFRSRLLAWKKLLRNLNWAWAMVGEAVAMHHERIFNSEGAANVSTGGQVWQALADLTVQARLQHARVSSVAPYDYLPSSQEGPEGRILHWAHRLRDSMVAPKGTADSVRRGTSRSFTYGTDVPYAYKHQYSAPGVGGRIIPARPFLDPQGGAAVAVGVLELMLAQKMRLA